MYFSTDVQFKNLLFQGLDIETDRDLVATCFVIFLVTVLFEGMKALKMCLDLRLDQKPSACARDHDRDAAPDLSDVSSTSDKKILLPSLPYSTRMLQIKKRRLLLHILSTFSMMMNVVVGYILMLIVMTFDTWLLVAVLAGSGLGYFVFNACGQVIQMRLKPQYTGSDEVSPPETSRF